METKDSSETSVGFQRITRRYIPDDSALRIYLFLSLRKEVRYTSKTLVPTFPTSRYHIPEYSNVNIYHHDNLKSPIHGYFNPSPSW
jgi:hypothetical protein